MKPTAINFLDFWTCGAGCARPSKPNIKHLLLLAAQNQRQQQREKAQLTSAHAMDHQASDETSSKQHGDDSEMEVGLELGYGKMSSSGAVHFLNDPYPFSRN